MKLSDICLIVFTQNKFNITLGIIFQTNTSYLFFIISGIQNNQTFRFLLKLYLTRDKINLHTPQQIKKHKLKVTSPLVIPIKF